MVLGSGPKTLLRLYNPCLALQFYIRKDTTAPFFHNRAPAPCSGNYFHWPWCDPYSQQMLFWTSALYCAGTAGTLLTKTPSLHEFLERKYTRKRSDLVVFGITRAAKEARWTATVFNPESAGVIDFHPFLRVSWWQLVSQVVIECNMYHRFWLCR